MPTFAEFLAEVARKGEAVNTLFEERLFQLVGVLHRITDALAGEQIPYELVGGLAVLVHVEEKDPEHSTLTRDVDLLVRRSDLDRIRVVAGKAGFQFRQSAGLDMLMYGPVPSARNAVHLIFAEEKVRPNQMFLKPAIMPNRKSILGREINVIPLADLVRIKLSAFRDKDRVHVRSMDAAGLITSEIEFALPRELRERLNHVRQTE